MNTEEDWRREREIGRPCLRCDGRGWVIDRNAPSGGEPCGCDDPLEDDAEPLGTPEGVKPTPTPAIAKGGVS